MIDHQREFSQSLHYYDMYGNMDTSQISSTPNVVGIPHDIRLLYRWAHQARRTGISLEYSFVSYRAFPRYIVLYDVKISYFISLPNIVGDVDLGCKWNGFSN